MFWRSFSIGELFITRGPGLTGAEVDNSREYLARKWGVDGAPDPDESGLPRWYAAQQVPVQVTPKWTLLTPRLFRYLDQEYINEFFDTGEIRLSSFAQFVKHSDEERQDDEGWTINIGNFEDSNDLDASSRVYSVSGAGANAYVLCTSLVESSSLMRSFATDGYFAIEDPWRFAHAVQEVIPDFTTGLQGHCLYSPRSREIYRRLDSNVIDLIEARKNNDGTLPMELIPEIDALMCGPERLLHKSSRFRQQAEYRILWGIGENVQPHITVSCPEARRYCAKIT